MIESNPVLNDMIIVPEACWPKFNPNTLIIQPKELEHDHKHECLEVLFIHVPEGSRYFPEFQLAVNDLLEDVWERIRHCNHPEANPPHDKVIPEHLVKHVAIVDPHEVELDSLLQAHVHPQVSCL